MAVDTKDFLVETSEQTSKISRLLARSEPYRQHHNKTIARSNIVPFSRSTEPLITTPDHRFTTSAFESHVKRGLPPHLLETATPVKSKSLPKHISLAWDETEANGIDASERRSGPLSESERKAALYDIYVSNVWISACIDVIAKRITSGGWEIEPITQGKGKKANRDKLMVLFSFINDSEDCLQFIRSIITDLLIYGEAYVEIVKGAKGVPVAMHKIDCQTITYQLSPHGQITQYIQTVQNHEPIIFGPDDVIRWWLPSPRANKLALSPIERIQNPVYADTSMANWVNMFFKKGARPPFWIELPESTDEKGAKRFLTYLRENYTGQHNAHMPMVLYGNAILKEVGKGAVDVDFKVGRSIARDEILAGFGVPLPMLGIQETAHLGAGTGDSSDAAFQFNVTDPIKQLVLEKINYRITKLGYKIDDYVFTCRYGDYRSEESISAIQDRKLRNGSVTINETRQEMGKQPYPQGGDTPFIVAGKDIEPVEMLEEMPDTQRSQNAVDLDLKQTQVKIQKKQLEAPDQPDQNSKQQGNTPQSKNATATSKPAKSKAKPSKKDDEDEEE